MFPSPPWLIFLLLPSIVWIGCWSSAVEGAPASAEVKQFPGFNGTMPSKHYAGYIPLGEGDEKQMYYYFAASERSPKDDPVMLFVTGGPFCSGLISLVSLVGPFKVEKNPDYLTSGTKLNLNAYGWTKVSNIIFIDAPVTTGYSYVKRSQECTKLFSDSYKSNLEESNNILREVTTNFPNSFCEANKDFMTYDSETISDVYKFTIKWFQEFPEYLSNPFYLIGVSYSGVYVPPLAQAFVNDIENGVEPRINFKGFTLGNPATDIIIDHNANVPATHHMGLISDELYKDLTTSCNGSYWDNNDPDCLKYLRIHAKQVKGINQEHPLCMPCHVEMGLEMRPYEEASYEHYRHFGIKDRDGIQCHDYNERVEQLFNLQSSRESLHAAQVEETGKWIVCLHDYNYTRNLWNLESLLPLYLNLTMKGYRVFIYSGDHDMQIPPAASLEWIRMLNYSTIEERRPWLVEDQIAGYMTQYDHNLLFATFKGAGHIVTEYMPREAFIAYERWLSGSNSL